MSIKTIVLFKCVDCGLMNTFKTTLNKSQKMNLNKRCCEECFKTRHC